jgi:hypothetical protein
VGLAGRDVLWKPLVYFKIEKDPMPQLTMISASVVIAVMRCAPKTQSG